MPSTISPQLYCLIREKWYHAGMITHAEKDDIRFVHASTRSGVIESSLLDSYYMNNVKKFRRVIK